jgi:hypothetical protein
MGFSLSLELKLCRASSLANHPAIRAPRHRPGHSLQKPQGLGDSVLIKSEGNRLPLPSSSPSGMPRHRCHCGRDPVLSGRTLGKVSPAPHSHSRLMGIRTGLSCEGHALRRPMSQMKSRGLLLPSAVQGNGVRLQQPCHRQCDTSAGGPSALPLPGRTCQKCRAQGKDSRLGPYLSEYSWG